MVNGVGYEIEIEINIDFLRCTYIHVYRRYLIKNTFILRAVLCCPVLPCRRLIDLE